MTFRPIEPWRSLDELLDLALNERVRYIRLNLSPNGQQSRRVKHLTLDEFAAAVGAKNRQAPIEWEKGRTPRDYAEKIAALTPYPPAALGAPGEVELVRESFGRRLQELRDKIETEGAQRDRAIQGVVAQLAVFEAALEQIAPGLVPQLTEEAVPE